MLIMNLCRPIFHYLRSANSFQGVGIKRTLSYVEKCRYIQELKNNDLECVQCIPEGRFLVFKGSQPLVKEIPVPYDKSSPLAINWVSYKDLIEHKGDVSQTAVLIDVDNEKKARFVVQLKKRDEKTIKNLEHSSQGTFRDLRSSIFMVGWNDGQLISRGNSLLRFHIENIYCGLCGEKMLRNGSGCSRKCSTCKTTRYPYAHPVGIVLVTDPEREHALLVRQPRLPQEMFTCIAGFGDAGESLEDTVKREVAEEVGIEIQSVEYVLSQTWPFPSSLMAGCYAVAEKSEVNIDESELEAGRWFTREEIGEAVAKIEAHPLAFLRDSPGMRIPPPGAVACQLISHWFKRTPIKEIYPSVQ